MPVLGGSFAGYAQMAALYRQTWAEAGRDPALARVSTFGHLHVTETAEETQRDFYPYYSAYLRPMFKGPMPPATYAQILSPQGTLMGGSVQQVIDKLLILKHSVGSTRFAGQIDIGGQPFKDIAKGIELFATRVAPAVRAG